MTSRERMTTILAGEVPDRMAVFEHYWPETLNTVWPEQGYPAGADPMVVFDYDVQGLGWNVDTVPFRGVHEVLEETDRHYLVRDGRGARLRYWKGKSGTPEHVGFDCTSPEAWQRYRQPLLGFDETRITGDRLPEALEAAKAGERFCVMGNLHVFELMRATLGDVCMMESMLLEPAWIHDFCRVYTDLYKAHYDWIFTRIGKPDGMFIYEDLGYSNGPWTSPRIYRELIQPYHTELVGFFHDHGLPVILHTCGDVRQLFDAILESGWDCLQPMEAKAGCHVVEFADRMVEQGRRIGYMGNIDVTVLNTNDLDRITQEVASKVDALKQRGVGYCFHSDHSIPPDVNLASYQHALAVLRERGDYA